jgi:hypothetical protein
MYLALKVFTNKFERIVQCVDSSELDIVTVHTHTQRV